MQNLILTRDQDTVTNFGRSSLSLGQGYLSKSLDNDHLQSFGRSSALINDLCEYIDYYTTPKKSWLDSIPFLGGALKSNRFKGMTIDSVVEAFAKQIKEATSTVDKAIKYSRDTIKGIDVAVDKAEEDLDKVKAELKANIDISYSQYNQLKHIPQENRTDEENDELWTMEQNITIIDGTRVALETLIGSLKMNKEMYKKIVDAGIKVQNKSRQCETLPAIMKSALQIMQVTNALSSATSSLESTEHVVKALVSGAASSTNALTDQTNSIKQVSLQFNEIINSLREVKNDCDEVINGLGG